MMSKAAIIQAIEELGTKTSVPVLKSRAEVIAGTYVSYVYVVKVRGDYRRENGDSGDNRTYKGQPRRNMLNDHTANLHQIKRIATFCNKGRPTPESIASLLGVGTPNAFHSVEQLSNAVSDMANLQLKIAG